MMTNRSAPSGTIVPSLIYNDVAKAMEWLCNVFGFTERLRIHGEDGTVGHAQLSIGQGGVMLGAARVCQGFSSADTTQFGPPDLGRVSQTLLVRVENVDRHFEHAKDRGARILNPPETYPYGERQYTAADLEGHRWTFSQTVSDVDPTHWGATVSHIAHPLAALPRPRLCYLEIPSADLNRSVTFYKNVFDWNIRHRGSDRPSFDDATGYVSGAWILGRSPSLDPGLLPYIWVDGIDRTLEAVKANGGEVVASAQLDSPGGEWIATFRDPAGNLIGLYQEGPR